MLLPFIVSTPTVCFRIADSSHVDLDRTQQDNGHTPMILGNPAMINAYKSGIGFPCERVHGR